MALVVTHILGRHLVRMVVFSSDKQTVVSIDEYGFLIYVVCYSDYRYSCKLDPAGDVRIVLL